MLQRKLSKLANIPGRLFILHRFYMTMVKDFTYASINEQIRKLYKVVRMRKTYLPKSKDFVLGTKTKLLDFCAYYEFAHL